MNLKGLQLKKSAKFVVLLMTSLVIASVSAGTFLSLTTTSTVSVYESDVYFVEGSDNNTAGAFLTLDGTNTTATITGLRAYPNATFTYEDVTSVRNNATSGTTLIRLSPDTNPSTNPEDFEYIKFMLNGTTARWLNYTSNGVTWTNPSAATSWITIPTSTQWPVAIVTKANATATVNDSVTISIKIDVD